MTRAICMLCCLFLAYLPALPASAAEREVPQLQIFVQEEEVRTASASMEDSHKWIIRFDIPETADLTQWSVMQTLSPYLTYDPESVEVNISYMDGSRDRWITGEHYNYTGGTVFVDKDIADRLHLTFTEKANLRRNQTSAVSIRYNAAFRKDVPMGIQILGTAQLICMDSSGSRISVLSDKAAISTGGFGICLTNERGDPIPGGKFMVAREATAEELTENTSIVELLDTGNDVIPVVYAAFRNEVGEKHYENETDIHGTARFLGLSYGKYYLVQTEIPEGMGTVSSPVKVTVNESSHLTAADGWMDTAGTIIDNTITIVSRTLVMPETGGPGTRGYTVTGILVILSACVLLWTNRKGKLPV